MIPFPEERSRVTGGQALSDDGVVIAVDGVTGRVAFAALRRSRRRARSGAFAVSYEPAPRGDETRRFAYSVPRRFGTAVDRNLYRRRLRAVTSESASQVPPGSYLIGLGPDARGVSFQDLRRRVIEAMQRASGGPNP